MIARLATLDLPLAMALTNEFAEEAEFEIEKSHYLRQLNELQDAAKKLPSKPSPQERASFFAALRTPKTDYHMVNRAFDRLVPPNGKATPDRQIDALFLELLQRQRRPMEYEPERLQLAAAKRLGPRIWNEFFGKLRVGEDELPEFDDWLPALCEIALSHPTPFRGNLRKALTPELRASKGSLDQVLLAIWVLDFRELKPQIERLATSGPEDYEGSHGTTASTEKTSVTHRLHRARHIAALWNEEDAATRARLLVAFALAQADKFADREQPAARVWRLRLAALARQLQPKHRARALQFVAWCDTHVPAQAPWAAKELRELLKESRSALANR